MAGLLGCDRHGRMLRGLGGLCPAARGTWSVGGMTAKTGGLQQQNGRLGSNSSQWGLSAPRQQHRENEKDREGVREEGIEVLLSLHRCPGWRYRVSTRPRERTCRSSRRLEEWKTEQKWVMSICEGSGHLQRPYRKHILSICVCGRNSKLNSLLSDLPMRAFQSWGSYFETVPRGKYFAVTSLWRLEKFLLKFLMRNKNIQ